MIVAFYAISAAVLVLAWIAVTNPNLVRAALALALSFFSLAGIFWLLGSPFVAVLQLVVNAGAIPIVTIFIVMMTRSKYARALRSTLIAAITLALPFAAASLLFFNPSALGMQASPSFLSVERLGAEMLSVRGRSLELSDGSSLEIQAGSIIAFEATAIVLLVAFVAAIIIAKRDDSESLEANANEGSADA